ncbi:FIG00431466: hypothetical protein [plant metagenome]|uniref:Uncharacterized protein n=2 Tax=root TaxID=1 RepID=A0A1C3K1Y3_9BURK|nr:hypothetical protein [Orrella dioscoreae]SBT25510.1 FIG00431466: hypothetical protein [Orrella dioscoreae]SOE46282.1 FIG00431466: hypothetical protein [Orrella dioscoreae]
MRSQITVIFDPRRSLDLTVQTVPGDDSAAQARQWLDDTWEQLGCEPLRPSGKVLLLDKVLGIADAYGHERLVAEPEIARVFAENVARALERPRITVDLPGLMVGY